MPQADDIPITEDSVPGRASPNHTARRPAIDSLRRRGLGLAGLNAALQFLFPFGALFRRRTRPDEPDNASFGSTAPWIVPIGLLIGLAWAGTFKATYRDVLIPIRVMPALAVILLECLVLGPFLVLGLARTVDLLTRPRGTGASPVFPYPESNSTMPLSSLGTLTLCLTVLSQWVLIASVPVAPPWWPSLEDWRYHFRHVYPAPVYRPLVLAPIWGRWAILLAATVGRTARNTDPQTAEFCRSMRPARLLRHAVFPFVITSIYLSREGNYLTGIIVGLLVFVIAFMASVVLARRSGGQTRQSLYAVGEVGQLAFLAIYRAFWPLIHG